MVNHTKISPLFYTIIKIEGMKSFYAWHQATSLEQIMFVPDITQKGSGAVMMNKKVLIIPPANALGKYVKTKTIALTNMAQDYDIACKIRAYINALEPVADMNDEKTAQFIDWAKKKADWFDPV